MTAEEVSIILSALTKAVLLDIDLSTSVYIDAAETRLKEEAAAQAKERETIAATIGSAMESLAAKDLTFRMENQLPAAYVKLESDLNFAIEQIEAAMLGVVSATDAIRTGASEIAMASDELSRRTEEQAASLEQTTAAVNEITATVQKTADGAKSLRDVAATANSVVSSSSDVVRKAVLAMGKIEASSQQIGAIIGVINEIAMQTNLLSLNAAVEAARAGESGRGFAVVATEVRSLAQRSAAAAKEIQAIVSSSTALVVEGVKLVNLTGGTLTKISSSMSDINSLVSEIASQAQDQALGLKQVNAAVNQMDQATQQNAAMAEEATAATQSLAAQSERLAELIGEFNVSSSSSTKLHDRSQSGLGATARSGRPSAPKRVA